MYLSLSRTALFATAALGGLLLASAAARAQTVRIFDEAPSIEQLRGIMVPESRPGQGRSIVLLRPDALPRTNAVPAALVQSPLVQSSEPAPVVAPVAQMIAAEPVAAAEPVRPTVTAIKAAARPEPQATGSDTGSAGAGIVGFRINFALDSATLPSTSYAFLDRMAELMQQEPQVKLQVEGHTDALGSADYNQGLSERRAAAVASYLAQQRGIDPDRLVVTGKGMAEPLTQNPYDGRNRRVQFVRLG